MAKSAKKSGQGGELKSFAHMAKRPPKVHKGVSNDMLPGKTRSAVMPPPTKDTKSSKHR